MPAKKIAAALCAALLLAAFSLNAAAMSDISGHWCENRISAWVNRGIMDGYPDGTFRPEGDITRAEFVKITNRAFGFTGMSANIFSDVASSSWYYNDVRIARYYGYINGYPDGTFRPNENITRQETAKIISTIMALPQSTAASASITDWSSGIDEWARGYVGSVYSNKIMGTYSNGEFKGRQNLTRAECVYYLWEATNALGVAPKSPDKTIRQTAYNPETREMVNNLTIDYSGNVDISNLTIEGNVIITSKVGDRTVTLTNCTVDGTIYLDYGNLVLDGVTGCAIDADSNAVDRTVTLKGQSTFERMNTNRSSIVDQSGVTGEGKGVQALTVGSKYAAQTVLMGVFPQVDVAHSSQTVMLASGTIKELESSFSGTTVTLGQNTNAEYIYLSGQSSKAWGPGSVGHAYIDRSGLSLQREPAKLSGPNTPFYSGDFKLTFTVKDGSANKTLSGAEIKLDTYMASGKTAGNGSLEFSRIPDKTILYTVTMDGYEDVSGTVAMNGTSTFVDVLLKPKGEFTATLTVVDSVTNNPITGIYGLLTSSGNQASSPSDSGGRMTFSKLGSSAYTYRITAAGYVSETGSFTVSAKDLIVANPVKMQKTKVNLKAFAAYDQTTAIPDFEYSIAGFTNGFVRSQTGGTAVIEGLAAEKSYTATIRAVNADGTVNTAYGTNSVTIVPLDSKTATEVKGYIVSGETHTYSVTVLSWDGLSSVDGATVSLSNGTWSGSAVTVSGIAQITGVPSAGNYTLTITKSGYRSYSSAGGSVTVNSSNITNTVNLTGIRKVTVNVELADTTKLQGMTVTLEAVADATRFTATTNASGNAVFDNVPDGEYKVLSLHAGYMIARGTTVKIGPDIDFDFTADDLDLIFTLLMLVDTAGTIAPLSDGETVTLTQVDPDGAPIGTPPVSKLVVSGGATEEFQLVRGDYMVEVAGHTCAPPIITLTMTAEGTQMSVTLTPLAP